MKDIVVLVSVPHTGTNLLLRDVFRGYKKVSNEGDHFGKGVVFTHLDPDPNVLRFLQPFLSRYPIVVPLRNPVSCAISWKSRNKPVSEMIGYWVNLIENIHPYNPCYVPVDSDDRDKYLSVMNKKLDTDLATSWPIVNSINKSVELSQDESQLVDSLRTKYNHFFREFGYG